jgi:hypothetical protein
LRPNAREVRRSLGRPHDLLVDAQAPESIQSIRDQAVAADLVAGKLELVGQDHLEAGACELLCTGAASRASANDQHVAGGGGFEQGHRQSDTKLRILGRAARPAAPAVGLMGIKPAQRSAGDDGTWMIV